MRIQALGVIEDAVLELHPGLTVITGETGAGKTMVVTGLHLLSGGRADASRVRAGSSRAVVEGRFGTSEQHAVSAEIAHRSGGEVDEDGSVIAVRTVNADGRSRAHLGGRSVPNTVLAELAESAMALHGQNEQLRLLKPAEQRALLDRAGGTEVAEALADYQHTYRQWTQLRRELADRRARSRELALEADVLRHGIAEIEAVAPEPGEDEALATEAARLSEADERRELATHARAALTGDAELAENEPPALGALGLLADARRRLSTTTDPQLREMEPRLAEAAAVLDDVQSELSSYLEALQADPQRLEEVFSRQAQLKQLTKKYAADTDGVLAWLADARARLSGMDTSEEALAGLADQVRVLAAELAEKAEQLSTARQKAASTVEEAVTAELAGLAMPNAQLQVAVTQSSGAAQDDNSIEIAGEHVSAGKHGIDDVEIRLIAHSGAQPLPIHKAASGGELSRVMLALELVLADAYTVPTLVFDEVDAGVGGRAAVEVGRRLARLARGHQVLVVTHLPQVAAYADQHVVIDKTDIHENTASAAGDSGGFTHSHIRVVSDAERVDELARMLAGLDDTATGRAHAEELLATARRDHRGEGV